MKKGVGLGALILLVSSFGFAAVVPRMSDAPGEKNFFGKPEKDSLKKRCARFFIARYGSDHVERALVSCPPDIRVFVRNYGMALVQDLLMFVGADATHAKLEILNAIILNAVHQKRTDILRLIIEHLYVSEGKPVICMLAAQGYTQSCRHLLDNGQEIDRANCLGKTALMCAAQNGKEETVQALLRYAPNTDLKTVCNKTAMELAQESGHAHIALKIKEHHENHENKII